MLFSFSVFAWVPLAIGLGQAALRVVGSQTVTNLGYATLFGSAAALIGLQTGALEFKKQDSNGNDVTMRMPLTDLPRDRPTVDLPANTPTTYTPPAFKCPSNVTLPPADLGCFIANQVTSYTLSGSVCNVKNEVTFSPKSPSPEGCPSNPPAPDISYSQFGATAAPPEDQTCGDGYTKNASNQCVLTEPQKIPDKNCDLQSSTSSSGSKYITNSNDPDCNGVWSAEEAAQISEQNGLINAYSAAFKMMHPENGTPQDVLMQIYPATPSGGYSGSCPYQVCIPIPGMPGHYRIAGLTSTAEGNTNYTAIDVNSAGVIDSVRSGTIAGTLAGAGTTYTNAAGQTAVVQPGQAVLVNGSNTGALVQAPAVQAPALQLPSDYARSGEASTAADKIVNKLSETDSMTDLAAPEITNPLIQYFNPLYSWAPSVVSGTCPAGSFSWNGQTYGFNQFCTLFEEYSPAIQSVMLVVSVVFSLFIVLGA